MSNYTYDPSKIFDGGLNQLRFELGDVEVEGGKASCALCDEEYLAIAENTKGQSWGRIKFACLKAIMMRFSYEVDYSADGMSLSLSERYKRWKAMYDEGKKQYEIGGDIFGTLSKPYGGVNGAGGHYFYLGMMQNGDGRR